MNKKKKKARLDYKLKEWVYREPEEWLRHDLEEWLRHELWYEREIIAFICGRVPDRHAPDDEELNQAADFIERAVKADKLHPVGKHETEDKMYRTRMFDPEKIITWATDRFPKFPPFKELMEENQSLKKIDNQNKVQAIDLKNKKRPVKQRDYTPRDALSRLMLKLAVEFEKRQGGALIGADELLSLLKDKGARIDKNNNIEYVNFTDITRKTVITVSKSAFKKRLTRIRNHRQAAPL